MKLKKLLWINLNPTEKLNRFVHSLWVLCLTTIVLFIYTEIAWAITMSLVLLSITFFEYQSLKKAAYEFEKNNVN